MFALRSSIGILGQRWDLVHTRAEGVEESGKGVWFIVPGFQITLAQPNTRSTTTKNVLTGPAQAAHERR